MNRSLYIRLIGTLVAALLCIQVGAIPAVAEDMSIQAIPVFTISGTGDGHGIGMSQYGAQGSALAGKTYDWILKHYYTGVTIGTVGPSIARVNLDSAYTSTYAAYSGQASWTLRSVASPMLITRTGDTPLTLAADTYYVFTNVGGTVSVHTEAGVLQGSFTGSPLVTPQGPGSTYPPLIEVKSHSGPSHEPFRWYRGSMLLDVKPSDKLALINQVDMEQYLYGVVPRESPASWRPEALKAQAVAARSYAYVEVAANIILKCTTYSQVYDGYAYIDSGVVKPNEYASTNAAVNATAGQVIKIGSAVMKAYFFSQSGGVTANNEDVWVTGSPLAYTRSVLDTYEYLANPGYSPWAPTTLSGLQMADRLRTVSGVPASPTWVTGSTVERAASGHARYVTFRFSNGASVRISGDTVRSKLGLKSTKFYISGFPIERIEGANRYDTAAKIAAKAFPTNAPAVVLASGQDFPDALTGSGLAGAAGGALLLTQKDALPDIVRAELQTLNPQTVYIMGGTAAVSSSVEAAVKAALPSAVTTRVAGTDRYHTARLAAEKARELAPAAKAIVVSGTSWADAASASALAYAKGYPILLVPTSGVNANTDAFLRSAKPPTTIIAGGPVAVVASADARLASLTGGTVTRLQGADRYATSAEIARYSGNVNEGETFTYEETYVATGLNYADALAGGMLAGIRGNPLVLTLPDACPAGTATFLREKRLAIGQLWLLGGPGAVSETGKKALEAVMAQ